MEIWGGCTSPNVQEAFWFQNFPTSLGIKLPLNSWTHLAFVISDIESHAYVNGVVVDIHTSSKPRASGALLIGASPSTLTLQRFFLGYLDDIRFYNRPLSSTEVQELYTGIMITVSPSASPSPSSKPTRKPATASSTTSSLPISSIILIVVVIVLFVVCIFLVWWACTVSKKSVGISPLSNSSKIEGYETVSQSVAIPIHKQDTVLFTNQNVASYGYSMDVESHTVINNK
jgi:hypothetical protein